MAEATATQIAQFIATIAPLAQKAYKSLGKVKPSVCIGMACVECGYGTAGSCRHHSYIGQKVGTGKTATKYWGGKFFTSKTSEEYTVGKHTVIKAAFRSYESMEQCVFNYYELLNTKLYARVKAEADYATQMQQIKACGYMTSSTEVNSVIKIIETYGLTKYDLDTVVEGNPYTEPTANIKHNMSGNGVKWVQHELNRRGYGLKVDGIAGDKTIAAVKDFQLKFGLKVDGIVGQATRKALKNG
jgi:flagellum-specific peptidoglycan hydrolase FlgJ